MTCTGVAEIVTEPKGPKQAVMVTWVDMGANDQEMSSYSLDTANAI